MANDSEVLNWTCQHNTAENSTTYDFGSGFQIIENRTTNMCYKLLNGEPKGDFPTTGMLLETWIQILKNYAQMAKN